MCVIGMDILLLTYMNTGIRALITCWYILHRFHSLTWWIHRDVIEEITYNQKFNIKLKPNTDFCPKHKFKDNTPLIIFHLEFHVRMEILVLHVYICMLGLDSYVCMYVWILIHSIRIWGIHIICTLGSAEPWHQGGRWGWYCVSGMYKTEIILSKDH